jgi:formylglycine-generating enzyme required for sulfatase activity
MYESIANAEMRIKQIRLPLDFEWSVAAGGEDPENRFPWDLAGNSTTDEKEIVRRMNIRESQIGHTTPVNAYLRGASLLGVMDMMGNVWEWQANTHGEKDEGLTTMVLRGASESSKIEKVRISARNFDIPEGGSRNTRTLLGFRVAIIPRK